MKIQNDGMGRSEAAGTITPGRAAPAKTRPGAVAGPTGEDRVELRPAADALLSEALGDSAKVERLREAVKSGTYSVSAREIAAKLVDEHLDEPGSKAE